MKLENIIKKFCGVNHNEENYEIGGGLDGTKFASRRHEDAKSDKGKLTFGEAVQMFKKATGESIDFVKEIIEYAVPNMEWHHAGQLPKSYGGGMKKTYFLNAGEICMIANNWNDLVSKLELSKAEEKKREEEKRNVEERKLNFLIENAEKVERISERPLFFYMTKREMNGKYGWFDSSFKSYNLPEYFSGWKFESEEKYNEFLNLK